MKSIFVIGHLDIRIFLKDKSGWFWLFIAPLLFIYFFGMTNPPPREPSNPNPGILIENNDTGQLGETFVAALGEQGITIFQPDEKDRAKRGIRIPENFSESIRAGEEAEVIFFKIEETAEAIESMVELRIVRALLSMNTNLFSIVLDGGSLATLERSELESYLAREAPVSLSVSFGARKPVPHGYGQTLPGMVVMFLLMNLMIFGASSVSKERLNGVMERMAVYPMRKYQIVTGKIYGRFLLAVVQIVYLLTIGELIFKVQMSHSPVLIALILFLFSWMAASLGVFIGSVLVSPEKTYGVCIGGSMVMAALGGCWWPMEVVPQSIQTIGHIFPTAWAMDGLHQLITFGGDLEHIVPELVIISLFAIGSHVLANFSLRYR